MRDTTLDRTDHPSRPRALALAAALITVGGFLDIFYAPFVVIAPIFDRPTPALTIALGTTLRR